MQTQAKDFIQKIAAIWTQGQIELLADYYSLDFQANFYGYEVNFAALIKRLQYMIQHQKQRQMQVLDAIGQANKLAARFHYTAIDSINGKIDLEFLGFYQLNAEAKISRAWAYANQAVDYRY